MDSAATAGRWRDSTGKLASLVRGIPIGLAVLLVLGVELRLAVWFAHEPAVMTLLDSVVYVEMARGDLFADPSRTAGYSAFLRAVHLLSDEVAVTILLQHLLGIATALLLYGAFRRLACPVWVAAVAAAGVLLSLDQILLEHTIISEPLFTFLVAMGLYAGVRSLDEPRPVAGSVTTRHLWIVAAGVAFGFSAWVRSVIVPALPFLAAWFAFAIEGAWRLRLGRAALAGAAALIVVGAYAGLQSQANGHFGLSRASGWALYSRVAPFADCSRFDPPAGTEALCESTPPAERSGPDYYGWASGSPAVEEFGERPDGNSELSAFARAAILGQPFEYLKTVGTDSLRYVFPHLDQQPFGDGVGWEGLDIDRRSEAEEEIGAELDRYFADEELEVGGVAGPLADLQDVLRLQPWTFALAALLALGGVILARGRLRRGMVLMVGTSALLLVIPPATAIWSARYAVPITGPLVGAAAGGAWLLAARLRGRDSAGGGADG